MLTIQAHVVVIGQINFRVPPQPSDNAVENSSNSVGASADFHIDVHLVVCLVLPSQNEKCINVRGVSDALTLLNNLLQWGANVACETPFFSKLITLGKFLEKKLSVGIPTETLIISQSIRV